MTRHAYLLSVGLGLALSPFAAARADPLQQWTWRGPLPPSSGIVGLTFGQGKFVAVGYEGTILTSTNGRKWSGANAGVAQNHNLNAVCYGNGLFVAAGYQTILISTNGNDWEDRSSGIDTFLFSVAYGNGAFVAVGIAGTILRSTDGNRWDPQSAGPISTLYGIDFVDGTFFAAGLPGVLSSQDGVEWTPRYNAAKLRSMTHGNGVLVAVGDNQSGTNVVSWSNDGGMTWWPGQAGISGLRLLSVTHGAAGFAAVSAEGVILHSRDGMTWSQDVAVPYPFLISAVTYADGLYLAGGGSRSANLWASSNALDWVRLDDPSSFFAVAYGNNVHVAVGAGSNVLTSVDGENWIPHGLGQNRVLFGVAFGNGIFTAVGYAGSLLTSPDGGNWTPQPLGTNLQLFAITYGANQFVASGSYGLVLVSSNAEQWQLRQTPVTDDLPAIVWTGQKFLAVNAGASLLQSTDASNWTVRPVATNSFTNSYAFHGVAYGNGQYVLVGERVRAISDIIVVTAVILASANGTQWVEQELAPPSGLRAVTFAHGVFVATGDYGMLLTSTDARQWSPRDTGTSHDLRALDYGKGRFTGVGVLGSILQSGFYGPPVFTGLAVTSTGLELYVGAGPNQSCRLQFNETMGANGWQDLADFITAERVVRLKDETASNAPQRFYRVIAP
jgi:hypothetical protein